MPYAALSAWTLVLTAAGYCAIRRSGFVNAHPYEALLLLGIPLTAGWASAVSIALYWEGGGYAVVVVVLVTLAGLYPRVRQRGSRLLALLWGGVHCADGPMAG